jgi:hypothetical protein
MKNNGRGKKREEPAAAHHYRLFGRNEVRHVLLDIVYAPHTNNNSLEVESNLDIDDRKFQ